LEPHFGVAYLYIGCAYIQQERYEDAVAAFRKAIEVTGGLPWAAEYIGYIHGLTGERDKAMKVLEKSAALMKQRYVSSTSLALIYLGLGEHDQAFELLDKAYGERDPLLPWLKGMPEFDCLRSDPRYLDLLLRLGLAS
jgi:tetratricopeptide (TPR) repeat protein